MRAVRAHWEGLAGALQAKLERRHGWGHDDFDALPGKDLVEVVEIEAGDKALQEGIALQELVFDAFGVASSDQRLPVSVLLMTRRACGCTGGAPGMLGITLREVRFRSS